MSALPELGPVGGSAFAIGAVTDADKMKATPAADTAALSTTRFTSL
jgi:hypothetical protein